MLPQASASQPLGPRWPATLGLGFHWDVVSHVHVPLKQTPCEEQPLGQGVCPTATPSRAKAESRQLERAGLLGRKAASRALAEERAIGSEGAGVS